MARQNKKTQIRNLKEQVQQHEYWIQLILKSLAIKRQEDIDNDPNFGKDVI